MKNLNIDINETGQLLKNLSIKTTSQAERGRLKQTARAYGQLLDRIERLDKKFLGQNTQRLQEAVHERDSMASGGEQETLLQSAQ